MSDCDADQYLVFAKLGGRLAVCKQAAQMFDREIFNLRRLNELEVRKQYLFKITDRFGALENLSDSEEINTAGRTLKRISKPQLKRVLICTN